jgi:hypothetical protein
MIPALGLIGVRSIECVRARYVPDAWANDHLANARGGFRRYPLRITSRRSSLAASQAGRPEPTLPVKCRPRAGGGRCLTAALLPVPAPRGRGTPLQQSPRALDGTAQTGASRRPRGKPPGRQIDSTTAGASRAWIHDCDREPAVSLPLSQSGRSCRSPCQSVLSQAPLPPQCRRTLGQRWPLSAR